jgi:hypothetical protein
LLIVDCTEVPWKLIRHLLHHWKKLVVLSLKKYDDRLCSVLQEVVLQSIFQAVFDHRKRKNKRLNLHPIMELFSALVGNTVRFLNLQNSHHDLWL